MSGRTDERVHASFPPFFHSSIPPFLLAFLGGVLFALLAVRAAAVDAVRRGAGRRTGRLNYRAGQKGLADSLAGAFLEERCRFVTDDVVNARGTAAGAARSMGDVVRDS